MLGLLLLFLLAAPAAAGAPVAGTLQGVHADDFDGGSSTTRWRLDTGARTRTLLPTRLPALSPGGASVAVEDELRGAGLAGPVKAAAPQAAPAVGARGVAVIAIKFGTAEAPWTTEELRARVFTAADSASAFFREPGVPRLFLE